MNVLTESVAYKKIALKFPHIAIRLKQSWGGEEFEHYMKALFTDTRNGERRGFPEEYLKLLIEIYDLYSLHYGKLDHEHDVWRYKI